MSDTASTNFLDEQLCVCMCVFKFLILVPRKSFLKSSFILCNLGLHCISNHNLRVPRGLGFLFRGGVVINIF